MPQTHEKNVPLLQNPRAVTDVATSRFHSNRSFRETDAMSLKDLHNRAESD